MSEENTPERSSVEMRLGLGPGAIVEGRYEIIRLLGEGGMGAVFEARHRAIGRSVAIKILKPELTMNEQYTGRFLQEARSAAELHHRHIVEIMDYGVSDGKPYMVMEYLRGESMSAFLARKGLLSASEAVEIMEPVLRALWVAHERGIIHRDIKPENIFLVHEEDGVVPKVVDFGIAKHHRADEVKLTTDAMALGTPAYMAPEQIMSSKSVTSAADQYAVGVTFYEALTGENPYDADTLNAFIVAKATQDPIPLTSRRPDLDPSFAAIVMKTLQRKPEDRFANILALRDALLPFRTGASGLHILSSAPSGDAVKSAPTNGLARPNDAQVPTIMTPASATIPGPLNVGGANGQNHAWSVGPTSSGVDVQGATLISPGAQGTPTVMTVTAPPHAPPASNHRGLAIVGALVMVSLGGAGVWRVTRSDPTPPSTTAQRPPEPPPANASVVFDIRVEPSSALIFLDGEQIGVGHSAVTRTRDGHHYQLEVRAAGHVPVHEVLTADSDTRIERHLTPETPVANADGNTPTGHGHPRPHPPLPGTPTVATPTVAAPPNVGHTDPPVDPPRGNHPRLDRDNPFGH